ncbi:MAG: hypothetical protein WC959_02730 [Kiritimatiellales bacterium]
MSLIDWIVLCVPLLIVIIIAKYTSRFLKSVADYMAGGRCAGRYMLCVARDEMSTGAVVFAMFFEIFNQAGFTYLWWNWMIMPVVLLLSISGFVVYRYRETRALTLAQFFEMRYSRRFRIFAGGLGFVAGIMNFGIIPAVGARFFVYYLGIPETVVIGEFAVPTFIILMALFMSITIYLTLAGGQVTVMVTDCISGLMDQWFFLIVTVVLILTFSWSEITEVMMNRPAGQSMMNPMDTKNLSDFNIWFIFMVIFLKFYGTMAWQNASAYNAAARTPHESRMGGVLGRWREYARLLTTTVLAMSAVAFLNHANYAAAAAPVHEVIDGIANPQIQKQMLAPAALGVLLPIGLKGIFAAIVLTGIFAGDTTHLHSWGSMFVQDVVLPRRKKPLSPAQHIKYLRIAMAGVGIFAFLFGCLFTQTEYIVMWFQLTMAIYVGGAGAVIIGGLYWKKGTVHAAWAAMLTGSLLSFGGILVRQFVPDFFMNGTQISCSAAAVAVLVYIIVSLLTCRKNFNMNWLLHRGDYAVKEDQVKVYQESRKKFRWSMFVGITDKFSLADRWIAGGVFGWGILWFIVMVIGTAWNQISPWSGNVWPHFWWWAAIGFPLVIGVFTTVWFTGGVLRDLRVFFAGLRSKRADETDDGTVHREAE